MGKGAVVIMLGLSLFLSAAHAEGAPPETDNLAMRILADLGKDESLAASPVWLKVRSLNGNVLLEGIANNREEKKRIEGKVRRIRGVKSVQNRMSVRS